MKYMGLQNWFKSNLSDKQKLTLKGAEFFGIVTIEKETEKAVLLKADDNGTVEMIWCPKSALHTETTLKVEAVKNQVALQNKKNAFNKYDTIFNFAKDSGVKGLRYKMKISTILEKCEEANISVPAEMLK